MNPEYSNDRQLEQSFQDLEDGVISTPDYSDLMHRLRNDPVVRRAYIEHMTVAAGLHELAESWAAQQVDSRDDTREVRDRRMMRWSFAAAAALVMLLAMIAGVVVLRERTLPPVSISEGAATSWRFEFGGIDEEGGFLPKTRVTVKQGSVEITTRSRSRIVLEGPASLEIHSPMTTTLHSGSAWFDIANRDKGFAVGTPRVRVVDLGTRFGVAVAQASDHVQVDSGRVRIVPRQAGLPELELNGGKAARSDLVGRCSEVPYVPDAFLRKPVDTVLAAHWTFDELEHGAFPADPEVPSRSPVRVAGFDGPPPPANIVPGRFGRALDLSAGDSFAESDFPGIPGRSARTVAFWMRSQPIARRIQTKSLDYTPPVLIWGDDDADGGSWSVRAHTASGVIGTQWGAATGRGWLVSGKTGTIDILDGEWHHIVSVYTGDINKKGRPEVLHYIDGEFVPPRSTRNAPIPDGGTRFSTGTGLRIGYDGFAPAGPTNTPLAIDELWVFRAALGASEVRSLFEHNRISPPSR